LLPAMIRSVALLLEFKLIDPALLILVPLTVRLVLSLKFRLSSESTVILLATPAMLSVTADAPCKLALPLSISTFVLLVGTPFDQLPEVFQTPDVPPTQHVPPAGQVNEIKGMLDARVVTEAADQLLGVVQFLVLPFQAVLGSREGPNGVMRPKALSCWPMPDLVINRAIKKRDDPIGRARSKVAECLALEERKNGCGLNVEDALQSPPPLRIRRFRFSKL